MMHVAFVRSEHGMAESRADDASGQAADRCQSGVSWPTISGDYLKPVSAVRPAIPGLAFMAAAVAVSRQMRHVGDVAMVAQIALSPRRMP